MLDRKKGRLFYLRIVISLILIGWLLYLADTSDLVASLAGANWLFIAIAVAMANGDRIMMSYKWNLLLKAKMIRLPFVDVLGAYYKASLLGSLFLPTVGADAVRIYDVSKKTGQTADVISSVVMERLIGVVAVACVGLLSLVLFITNVDRSGWDLIFKVLLALALVLTILALSLSRGYLKWVHTWLTASKWRILNKFGRIVASYHDYANHRQVLLIFLGWTIVEQFFSVTTAFLIAKAVHIDILFLYFVIFIPIIIMIVRLPISFDGYGVREALYVSFFSLVGVPPSQAFLVGFLYGLIVRFGTAPFALYFFLSRRTTIELKELNSKELALKE